MDSLKFEIQTPGFLYLFWIYCRVHFPEHNALLYSSLSEEDFQVGIKSQQKIMIMFKLYEIIGETIKNAMAQFQNLMCYTFGKIIRHKFPRSDLNISCYHIHGFYGVQYAVFTHLGIAQDRKKIIEIHEMLYNIVLKHTTQILVQRVIDESKTLK